MLAGHLTVNRRREQWWKRSLSGLAVVICLCCTRAGDRNAERRGTGAGEAPTVSLLPTKLGRDTSESPAHVTLWALGGSRLAIADKTKRRLFAYDLAGNLLWSVGPDEKGGYPPQPNALSWWREHLYVADVDARRGVWVFDAGGELRHHMVLPFARPVTGVSQAQGGMLIATTSSDSLLSAGNAPLVHLFDATGRPVRSGCPADPAYVTSARRHGMIAIFRAIGVLRAPEGIYCWLPLSPRIQLLTDSLEPTGDVSLAPWARRSTVDVPAAMDLLSVNAFRRTVTELQGVYLTPGFVHAVLATFDPAVGRDRYLVVRCSRGAAAPCLSTEVDQRVIGAVADDTLLVLEPRADVAAPVEVRRIAPRFGASP